MVTGRQTDADTQNKQTDRQTQTDRRRQTHTDADRQNIRIFAYSYMRNSYIRMAAFAYSFIRIFIWWHGALQHARPQNGSADIPPAYMDK